MTLPVATAARPKSPGSREPIRRGELYRLCEVGARLHVGRKTLIGMQRMGLATVTIGREKFVTGDDILDFVGKLRDEQQAAAERDSR